MVIYDYQKLQEQISNINKKDMYKKICKNIKKYRLQRYNEFKKEYSNNKLNPFTSENISALLDYSHTHYKRFESENDSTKMIPFDKLVKLSIILDIKLEDFLK